MRTSTESLLTQIEHLWAIRRAVTRLEAGSVLESADELASHLDEIRRATTDCPDIAGATGKARDHCLRFILRCHQGETSDQLRHQALHSIDDLEDEILRFKVLDESSIEMVRPDERQLSPAAACTSPLKRTTIEKSYVLRGDPVTRIHGFSGFENAGVFVTMP